MREGKERPWWSSAPAERTHEEKGRSQPAFFMGFDSAGSVRIGAQHPATLLEEQALRARGQDRRPA